MFLKHLSVSFMLVLLLISTALSQSPNVQEPAAADDQQANQRVLQRKALTLLEEVVAETQLLKSAENRIRVQIIAAELFWVHDENRARAIFKEATNGLIAIIGDLDPTDPQYHNLIQTPTQLRQEMLQAMTPRDAVLALDFLRATRMQWPAQMESSYKQPDYELQMEMNLASQIADKNPKLALQIAEESLAKGFSHSLVNVLSSLQGKDREAAMKLASDVIKKLHSENLLLNQEAASVSIDLLHMRRHARGTHPGSGPNQTAASNPSSIIDEGAYRELLDLVLTAALNAPTQPNSSDWMGHNIAQHLLHGLKTMLVEVEKYAPSRAPALRRKLADFNKALDPRSRRRNEFQELLQKGSVEAMLEAAPQAPPEMRQDVYRQAAWKALGQGEVERARQIINDHVSNQFERHRMLEDLDRQTAWRATGEGKFDEARQLISRFRSPEERIQAITQLAMAAAAKGHKESALQLLGEAQSLLGGRAESYAQMHAQLQIAHAYASLEPARGFEIIEALVNHLNELAAAAEVLNGFEQQYYKDGELRSQASNLSGTITQHAYELAWLSHSDFDRARSAASRFQRYEIRIMARLSVARGVLSDQFSTSRSGRIAVSPTQGGHRDSKTILRK